MWYESYMKTQGTGVPALAPDEDRGLADALASLRAGDGRTVDQARTSIDAILRR
jgi:hypothetical protein